MMNSTIARALVLLPVLWVASPTHAQQSNIDQAVAFLQKACVAGGSSTSIELVSVDSGKFELRDTGKRSASNVLTLTKKELEGYADQASALSAGQATEMRNCMRPHIDKIIAAMLTTNTSGAATSQTIETSGRVFVTSEFDLMMAGIATKPYYLWGHETLFKSIKLSPVRASHYIEIAVSNKLVNRNDNFSHCPCFSISEKGVSYVVSRGLTP